MEDSTQPNIITVPPDMILNLGLDKPEHSKSPKATPRVLLLLSSALEWSIQKNERSLHSISSKRKDGAVTIFDSSRPPGPSIRQYLDRIFKYCQCSPACFVAAQVYIDRFIRKTGLWLTSFNIHRLLITSLVVAAKFMDDVGHDNTHYAKVGGINLEEMNRLEMDFLFSIDFRLHVPVDVFTKYCNQLENEVSPSAACSTKARRIDKKQGK